MPHAVWKGSLRFGLVTIPVGLYPAEAPDELDLDLIEKKSHAPVGYQRINKKTGRSVKPADVVKGYQVSKGRYVVLSDQELKRAVPEATQTVEVVGFVDAEAIAPIYFERPYFLAPTGHGERAYALLREALTRAGRYALARLVVRTRQYVAAVYPWDRALVVHLLRYAHELRDPKQLDLPPALPRGAASGKEMAMAEKLLASMEDEWRPEDFKDDYRDELLTLIRKKARTGKEIKVEAAAEEEKPKAEVVDLMALLKQSVAEGGGKRARSSSRPKARKSA